MPSPRGSFAVVTSLANPAAGAEWSYTLTKKRRLLSVYSVLTTSATVANRQPRLQILSNTGAALYFSTPLPAQAASLAYVYSCYPEAPPPPTAAVNVMNFPIPDLVLPAGFGIGSSTVAIQAGDQWSNLSLTFDS